MSEQNSSWLVIALIIISLLFWRDHHKLTSIIDDRDDQIYDLENELESCTDNLDQANSNIDEAKWYAWETYDDMGYALDNLETVDY